MKLFLLRFVQIILIVGCFITYVQTFNLLFPFALGWVLGDFIRTFAPQSTEEDDTIIE